MVGFPTRAVASDGNGLEGRPPSPSARRRLRRSIRPEAESGYRPPMTHRERRAAALEAIAHALLERNCSPCPVLTRRSSGLQPTISGRRRQSSAGRTRGSRLRRSARRSPQPAQVCIERLRGGEGAAEVHSECRFGTARSGRRQVRRARACWLGTGQRTRSRVPGALGRSRRDGTPGSPWTPPSSSRGVSRRTS
jgi:hypothetical protein